MVPVTRPNAEDFLSSCNTKYGFLPHGLGSSHEWPLYPGSVGRSPSHVAQKLPGDADSVSCTKTLSPREVIMRLFAQTTHHWSITSTVRGVCFHAPIQTGAPDLSVLSMRAVYIPRHLNQASRHPVETGAEVQGMKAPPQGCGEDLECVRLNSSCLVCVSRDLTLSPLVLPHTSSTSRTGCYGTDMAETASVRFPPIALLPRVLE